MIRTRKPRAMVVVLGDFGRSPRMQYHALSLAENGFDVHIVAQKGSQPHQSVQQHPSIRQHLLSPPISGPRSLFLLYAPFKVLLQLLQLVWYMFISVGFVDTVLMQNPPAIPTLFLVRFYCFITRAKMIVDWHNFAYTLMAINMGKSHLVVRIAEKIEKYYARTAHAHFCVTKAMKKELETVWGLKDVNVLYDRPPKFFRNVSIQESHELFRRIEHLFPFKDSDSSANPGIETTLFTERKLRNLPASSTSGIKPRVSVSYDEVMFLPRSDRPGLIVSSTSWTKDEDFGILLKALQIVSEKFSADGKSTDPAKCRLVVLITGKGPMKEYYEEQISRSNLIGIHVVTAWLSAEDYPKLIASCDLGISLHTSSSGLDLPMKVVDMFGCGVPVCAVNFPCLPELVQDRHNGYIFDSSHELSEHIYRLFKDFPTKSEEFDSLKKNTRLFQRVKWHDNWNLHALPVFQKYS